MTDDPDLKEEMLAMASTDYDTIIRAWDREGVYQNRLIQIPELLDMTHVDSLRTRITLLITYVDDKSTERVECWSRALSAALSVKTPVWKII